jgi:O-antigen/teichoic acid export membrane protein
MIVLSLGGGLLGLVVVSAPVTLIAQVTGVWLVHRSAPELRFSWRGADRRLVRPILGFSASVFALLVSNQLSTQSDEVVIGAVRQLSLVTPYALARKLSELPNALTRQFVKVLLPVASELHAEQDRGRLRAVYIAGTRITLAAYIAIGSTLAVFSGPALQVWVGQEYRAYAHLVVILVLASMIDTSLWPASAVLQGMARHRFLAITGVCAGVANVLLSIALIRPFGVTGVALATLIVNAIECLGFVLPYALRATGTSPALALRQILVPAAAPAVPALLLMVALRHTLPIESYLTLTLAGSAGIAVYGIAYFSLSAGEVEREALRDMVASAMRASRLRLRRA